MPPVEIDLTRMSAHFINDREARMNHFEKTLGWGKPVATIKSNHSDDTYMTLTDTGVMVVRDDSNLILTAYLATITQAIMVYRKANGNKRMPTALWNQLNYNNNTPYWRNLVAA